MTHPTAQATSEAPGDRPGVNAAFRHGFAAETVISAPSLAQPASAG
ncbi:hypothetical protein [Phenylobacterium sp.]|nr:hypothetical protein [Phenylobacterium sp.]